MSTLASNVFRIECDVAAPGAPVNAINGGMVIIPRGKDCVFQIGIRNKFAWLENITNLSSVFVEIWDYTTHITTRTVFVSTSTIVNCSEGSWNDFTSQIAEITASAADTAALTADAAGTDYWLVISALTSAGKKIDLAYGRCQAIETGSQYAGSAPAVGNPAYPTRDEMLALIQALQKNFTVTSPDGTKTRKLGVTNDGEPIDYLL